MKKKVDEELKAFMLDNFDFDSLKEAGFWPKGTRRADYVTQAARVCTFFGFESVYEYGRLQMREVRDHGRCVTGRLPDTVGPEGYKQGGGCLIQTSRSAFDCPCCTKSQHTHDYPAFNKARIPIVDVKCSGCKRPLRLYTDIFNGELSVTEL